MIQTDILDGAVAPAIEAKSEGFWKTFEGLSFNDAMQKIANDMVGFCFRLLLAIAILYLGKFIIKKLYNFISNIMSRRNVDASLSTFLLSLIKMILYFILIITIVGILGIETSSFLALFASAGVAIGMALSGTLQNFAGGVLILLLKPYKVGDYIETQGYAGTVKAIQIFYTVINTVDNKAIIIPNGGLSTGTINNYSFESHRRVEWKVSLSYGADYEAAREVILEMLNSDERVIKEASAEGDDSGSKVARPPFVGLSEMADSSIVLVVRAWTLSTNYWDLYFEMNKRLYTELPQRGFTFPFPQLDIHLDAPVEKALTEGSKA